MPATIVTPTEYTECSADISALTAVQVSSEVAAPGGFVQFIAAAAQPEATERGLMVEAGGTLLADHIAVVGNSGKLWGKASAHNMDVFVK